MPRFVSLTQNLWWNMIQISSNSKQVILETESFPVQYFGDWDEVNEFIDALQKVAMETFGKPWESNHG